jgi:hypothetical protein
MKFPSMFRLKQVEQVANADGNRLFSFSAEYLSPVTRDGAGEKAVRILCNQGRVGAWSVSHHRVFVQYERHQDRFVH